MAVKASSYQAKVTDKFFKQFGAKAEKIANEEAQQMAIDMHFILSRRFPLKGGNGRYPLDVDRSPEKGGQHSFKGWRIQKRVNGEYWVSNHSLSSNEEIAYPYILANGKGWSTKVLMGDWKKLVRGADGLVYSKQMPNGLNPWLEIKRGDMEDRIVERFTKELV